MNERINKTSICSVVFLDIIGYSKKPVSEQLEDKQHFNALINEAVKDVAQNDRILLDTGDGAAIALLGAPEEALFISLTIRDGILKYNKQANQNLFVRIGINLGPVRMLTDINGQPNIIGDGINVAQRVMSFAEPNQILVSRSYYEITSRLTNEITEMFAYSGVKHDKHVREHEVYEIRSAKEQSTTPMVEDTPTPLPGETNDKVDNKRRYVVIALITGIILVLVLSALVVHFAKPNIEQVNAAPQISTVDSKSAVSTEPVAVPAKTKVVEKSSDNQQKSDVKNAEIKPKKVVKKDNPPKKKATDGDHEDASKPASTNNEADSASKQEKSGWDVFKQSVKQGTQNKNCSQGEIAMGQCH
ncbi:MAG TPA: adenylate/guanylate cyclase domain-containing protein [Methyloradius sp.]